MTQSVEQGRDNSDALASLKRLKSEVFDDSSEQLALALGRTTEEIEAWLSGEEQTDEDAEMKIHGLVQERLAE